MNACVSMSVCCYFQRAIAIWTLYTTLIIPFIYKSMKTLQFVRQIARFGLFSHAYLIFRYFCFARFFSSAALLYEIAYEVYVFSTNLHKSHVFALKCLRKSLIISWTHAFSWLLLLFVVVVSSFVNTFYWFWRGKAKWIVNVIYIYRMQFNSWFEIRVKLNEMSCIVLIASYRIVSNIVNRSMKYMRDLNELRWAGCK